MALLDGLPQEARARAELTLQIGLGSGLTSVEGYGTAATGSAYERTRQFCLQVGDRQRLLPVLYGLWNFEVAAGRHAAARELGGEMLQRAKDGGSSGQRVAAHSALGAILTFSGRWADGKAHAEQCIALHDPVEHESLKLHHAEDPCVQAHIVHGLCCWFLGSPDRALQSALRAVSLGRQLRHANTIGYAMAGVAWVHCLRGDTGRSLSAAQDAIAFGHEMGLPTWSAFPRIVRGWALSRQGNATDGIAEIAAGIELWLGTGGAIISTFHQAILADACMAAGRPDQAQEAADRGLQFAADHGEGFGEAELHRLRGLALLAKPQASRGEAETSLLRSLQVSRDQRAQGMELRAAVALARLWQEQRRADEAHALLQPLHAAFAEGFDTPDLVAATALLEELVEECRGHRAARQQP
jgi:predicted ATPase